MLRLLLLLASRRPRGRAALTILGIALGVALGYGVHLVNRAAVRDLAASVRELAGQAELEVRGGRSGFAESLYPQVARVAGVAWVKPGLELDIGVAGTQRTLRVVGIDAVREGRPELLGTDKVLLSPGAAQIVQGDRLPLAVGGRTVELEIAGTVPLKGAVALTDIATAQWRLERLGELNRLDIGLARAADREEVRRRVASLLPPGVFVSTIDEREQESAYPSRAYRVNMNALGLVALFTGGFLVFSAQALETARRRGEHALLRVLGMRRAEITRLVLLEAVLLGALGGALGIALGYALAAGAVQVLGADLGAGAFRGLSPELGFPVLAAALYFLAGVGVAILGALLPALDASAAPPARALKAGDEQGMLERISPAWPGLVLLAAGGGLAQLGPVGALPIFGYLAIACVLLGSVALMPFLSQMIFRAISMRKPAPLVLALAQLRGAPGQAAVSLAAIVASYALMAAMAIMVASFRESVDRWLDAVLPADIYVRSAFAGDAAYLDPRFEAAARGLPQVARADFLRVGRIVLDPSRPALPLIARDRAAKAFPMTGKTYPRRPNDPPAVWISEAVSDLYDLSPGRKTILPINGANREIIISGIFRDYARQHGAILIDRADYIALTGDRRVNDASLWLKPGATAADAMAAVRSLPGGGQLDIAEPGEIRRLSLRIFDRSFAATYAMEAVAMLVGLFGLSSSLGAIVLARRREFGVLRHLGVTRAQVAAMLAAEGGLLALVGAIAGLAAGGAISLILVYVVNRQSFNWSMELHLPLIFIASLTGILVVLAVITAVFAGREAMGIGPVRAVREDW